ncbi:MAG: hypothetical protein Q4A25_01420 [Candidatus Saccharibacteria bacterium]|nr:hypothetical protein [Candidatus Saccharibacteria bacterium]
MKQKVYFLPRGKNGLFGPTGEFGEIVAVTKTQLLNEAESKSLSARTKNKRRVRESLIFRPVKNYKSWSHFIGDCQTIGYDSISGVNIEHTINKALESRGIEEPCIAVFKMNDHSFVYSERGKPVIYNGRLYIEKGGSWYREEDADRTKEGEYLLTDTIPFPSDMDEAWREICTERYGQICDKYHIVPERR